MLKLVLTKKFLLHLLLAGAVVVLVVFGAYYFLLNYTKQDEVVEVPNLEGMDLFEAEQFLTEVALEGVVVDSLYLPDQKGGTIVQQEPLSAALVKENRKVYLTISRYSAPMVKLPNVVDQTLPLALAKLGSYGIEIKEIKSKPSDCIDCVIAVELNGKRIESGFPLEKGVKVSLLVGAGDTGEKISVPSLYGLSAEQARAVLNTYGLNLGATPCSDCETKIDSASAVIFKQTPSPSADNKISRGASIDVYLTTDVLKVPEVNVDSIKALIR